MNTRPSIGMGPLVATIAFLMSSSVLRNDGLRAADLSYNRDVRPILADKCFACHGPDDETREAELRLDVRENAMEAGAFEPGDAEASLLIERILSDDPDSMMPPASANKPLSKAERETIRQWIDEGAEYERHWAFEPIRAVDVLRQETKLGAALRLMRSSCVSWNTSNLRHRRKQIATR